MARPGTRSRGGYTPGVESVAGSRFGVGFALPCRVVPRFIATLPTRLTRHV